MKREKKPKLLFIIIMIEVKISCLSNQFCMRIGMRETFEVLCDF